MPNRRPGAGIGSAAEVTPFWQMRQRLQGKRFPKLFVPGLQRFVADFLE